MLKVNFVSSVLFFISLQIKLQCLKPSFAYSQLTFSVLRYLSRLQCKVYGSKERTRSGENDDKDTDYEDEDDHYIDYGDGEDDDGDNDDDDHHHHHHHHHDHDEKKTVFTSMGIINTVSPIILFVLSCFTTSKIKTSLTLTTEGRNSPISLCVSLNPLEARKRERETEKEREREKEKERQTDIRKERQRDRHRERETDRQTDKQRGKHSTMASASYEYNLPP